MRHLLTMIIVLVTAGGVATCSPGCLDRSMLEPWDFSDGEETDQESPQAAASPAQPEDHNVQQGNIAPQDSKKLVDLQQAKRDNPNLIEVENRINATDPISAAGSAYFAITSRAHLSALKHSIDIYKAEHDRNPPFDEFSNMLQEANVDLKGLYRWQMYGYDAESGMLAILEDPDMKAQMKAD